MSSTSLPAVPSSPTSCKARGSTAPWCRWANERACAVVDCAACRLVLYVLAGLAGRRAGGAWRCFPRRANAAARGRDPSVGQALVGGPFTLTDQTGKRVTDQDFRGRFMLVFFGFTFCPDVCPTALQVMAAALDKLGPKAERITPVLDHRRSRARYAGPACSLCEELPSAPRRSDRLGRGDRCGRQSLPCLREEGARPEVDRRLHHGSFFHHLRHGSGRQRTVPTSRMRPTSTRWRSDWPQAAESTRVKKVCTSANIAARVLRQHGLLPNHESVHSAVSNDVEDRNTSPALRKRGVNGAPGPLDALGTKTGGHARAALPLV